MLLIRSEIGASRLLSARRRCGAPHADDAVLAGGEDAAAVGGEGNGVDRSGMAAKDAGRPAVAQVPQLHLAVLAGGGEQAVDPRAP